VLAHKSRDIHDISVAFGADFGDCGYYGHDYLSVVLLKPIRRAMPNLFKHTVVSNAGTGFSEQGMRGE
jgi:hypothetical protein